MHHVVVVQGVVEVKIHSFRPTVVVTLSVNMMCTHLYYCSMSCLYCRMLYNTNILQYVCMCVCVYWKHALEELLTNFYDGSIGADEQLQINSCGYTIS